MEKLKIITLIIGLIILVIFLYASIVLYFFYLEQKDKIFENNCYFNFTNCSYDYIYQIDRDYNHSINKLRDFLSNGS